jgi:hypothetical protein
VCVLAAAFSLPAGMDQLDIIDKFRDGARLSFAEVEDADDQLNRIAQVQFGLILLTGIAWLLWQSLAHRSERGIGLRHSKFPPRDAVLWWFIPIGQLIMPKRVMDEIWRGSDPGLRGDEPNFASLHVDPLVHIWWFAWIAGTVGNRLAHYAYDRANTLGSAEIAIRAYMAAEVALMLAGALGILVVLRITERVEERQAQMPQTAGRATPVGGMVYATGAADAAANPNSVGPPGS